MDYQNILFAVEDGIATITINRPKALNALNQATVSELKDVVEKIAADKAIKVVIITGAGAKSFVAGADIKEMASKNAAEGREWGQFGQNVFTEIENLPQPVIAAINGFALGGGCELSCACDIRYAAENAKFGQPEVGLGITPGFGGTQRLTRVVGRGHAKELIYTGGMIDAEKAKAIGLVNEVFPQEELMPAAVKLAKILTPILPHTMEEIWGFLKEPEDYVQLTNMPEVEEYANHDDLLENWGKFMKLRDDVLKALEDARNKKIIGKSFEATVTIYPDKETKAMLQDLDADFRQILIVSKLTIADGEAPDNAEQLNNASVVVEHAEGEVCPRCRMIRTDIGVDPKLPMLCGRCAKIVEADYPEAVQEGFEN